MQRNDVSPWEWSKAFGFSQAVEIVGAQRLLICSGQTAIGDDGSAPTTTDMGEQVGKALQNLVTVLNAAGMSTADIVKLTFFTTDVDELLGAYPAVLEVLGPNLPASTVIGVARLAFPELKIEIEATAAK